MDRRPHRHLSEIIRQASEPRVLLALALYWSLRIYRQHIEGRLRGYLLPDRRSPTLLAHWVAEDRRHARPLRPIQLLAPVMIAELTLVLIASQLPANDALLAGAVGNLVIIGAVLLPSTKQHV